MTNITLSENVLSTTVTIPILDDELSEPMEVFELRILESELANTRLLKPVGVITIVDDEAGERQNNCVNSKHGIICHTIIL